LWQYLFFSTLSTASVPTFQTLSKYHLPDVRLKSGLWLHQQKPIRLKKHGYKEKSFFRHGFDFLRRIFCNLSLFPREFDLALRFLS
jgi:hypothetical protein